MVWKFFGGFNFIFIIVYGDFKFVVCVFVFWGKRWIEEVVLFMRLEVVIFKIICERIIVFVLEVYRFDLIFGNDNC